MPFVDATGMRDAPPDNIFSKKRKTEHYRPNIFSEAAFGLARGTEGLIGSVGDMANWLGEVGGDPELTKWGRQHADYWREAASTGMERRRPDMTLGKHPFVASAGLLGEALPSVALGYMGGVGAFKAAGAFGLIQKGQKLTKLTQFGLGFLGTQPLGAVIGANFYREARDNGLDVKTASKYAMLDWIAESALEVVPLMEFMRPGTNIGRKFLRTATTEGLEELAQGVFSNALKVYGWKGTERLYEDIVDGLLEQFVGGFLAGGAMGGGRAILQKNQHTLEEIAGDLSKKLRRDGVKGDNGKPITYDATLNLVNTVAEKSIINNHKDIITLVENEIKNRAGTLKSKVLNRENAMDTVKSYLVAKPGDKPGDKPGVHTVTTVKPKSEYDSLSSEEQLIADDKLAQKLGEINMPAADGRTLNIADLPELIKFELREIAARSKSEPIDEADIHEVFQKQRILILGGTVASGNPEDLASQNVGLFYGPRMYEDIDPKTSMEATGAVVRKSPIIPLDLLMAKLALASKLDKSNPAYVNLAKLEIVGTRARSPENVAAKIADFLKSGAPGTFKVDDLDIMGDDFALEMEMLNYDKELTQALMQVRDYMKSGGGPNFMRSFKHLQVVLTKSAPEGNVMGSWTRNNPNQITIFADDIQRYMEVVKQNPTMYNLESLPDAIMHKIMHEQGHFLLRVNQPKLLEGLKKGDVQQSVVQTVEEILTNRYEALKGTVSSDLLLSLMKWDNQEGRPTSELLGWAEEVAVDALAYKNLYDLQPNVALQHGLQAAYYDVNGVNFTQHIDSWINRYNAENEIKVTKDEVFLIVKSIFDNAVLLSQQRISVAKSVELQHQLLGASKWTTGKYTKINPIRSAKRDAGIWFRPSGEAVMDSGQQEFQFAQREEIEDLPHIFSKETTYYHGTPFTFDTFTTDNENMRGGGLHAWGGEGINFTNDKNAATKWAEERAAGDELRDEVEGAKPRVIPVKLNPKKVLDISKQKHSDLFYTKSSQQLLEQGFDLITFGNGNITVLDPSIISIESDTQFAKRTPDPFVAPKGKAKLEKTILRQRGDTPSEGYKFVPGILTDERTARLQELIQRVLKGNAGAQEAVYQEFTEDEVAEFLFNKEKDVAILDQVVMSDEQNEAETIKPEITPWESQLAQEEEIGREQRKKKREVEWEQRERLEYKDFNTIDELAEVLNREYLEKENSEAAQIKSMLYGDKIEKGKRTTPVASLIGSDNMTKRQIEDARKDAGIEVRGVESTLRNDLLKWTRKTQRWLVVQRDLVFRKKSAELVGDTLAQYKADKGIADAASIKRLQNKLSSAPNYERLQEVVKDISSTYYHLKKAINAIHDSGVTVVSELWMEDRNKWLKADKIDDGSRVRVPPTGRSAKRLTKKNKWGKEIEYYVGITPSPDNSALEVRINFLIDQLELVKEALAGQNKQLKSDLSRGGMKLTETGVRLWDLRTNRDILVAPGNYMLTKKGLNTIISGNDLDVLIDGQLYNLGEILVENSLFSDIPKAGVEYFNYQGNDRTTQNAMWSGVGSRIKKRIDDVLTDTQKNRLSESLNPQAVKENMLEYSWQLKALIAIGKKINPTLTDADIRKSLGAMGDPTSSKHVRLKSNVSKETVEQIVSDYMKERHAASLASFDATNITNIIIQGVNDFVKKEFPGKTAREQQDLLDSYLNLMHFANEEILTVKGTYDFRISEIGGGGFWQNGRINAPKYKKGTQNTSERDATVEIYTDLMRLLGKPIDDQRIQSLMNSRDTLLFWSQLPKQLQDIIMISKNHVEDVMYKELLDSGLLDRTDNEANVRRGFTHMFWAHTDPDKKASKIKTVELKKSIPQKKYRTATESAFATGRDPDLAAGLYTINNYAAALGHYVDESMRRVNQNDMINKLKDITPVDANGVPTLKDSDGIVQPINYIAFESDINVVKNTKGMRPTMYLSSLGYQQMKNAPGLIDRRGGAFNPPWVHPDISALLHQLYDSKDEASYLDGILQVNGFIKRQIMLSPYNFAIQIASSPMLWMRPKLAYELGIKPLFWKGGLAAGAIKEYRKQLKNPDPMSHMKQAEYDPERVNLFVRHGARNFNAAWVMETMFDSKMMEKHPLLRTSAENIKETIFGKFGLDTYVFNHYVGRVMYSFMSGMTDRFLADPTFMPGQAEKKRLGEAARMAVAFANDTSGMIDRNIYGAEGKILQVMLFARDFTMSFLRQVTGAAYLPAKALGYKHKYRIGDWSGLNSLLHGDKSTAELTYLSKYYQAHLAKIFMTKFLLFTLLQFGMSFFDDDEEDKKEGVFAKKRWMHHNEPGKFGMIRTPFKGSSGEPTYVDPLIWREMTQFITLSPWGRGPAAFAKGKLSWSIKTFGELVSNTNFMGQPITDATGAISVGEAYVDRGLHVAKSTLPTFLRQRGRTPFFPSMIAGAAGLNLKSGVNAKDPHELLRMRRAVKQEQYYDSKTRERMYNASPKKLLQMRFNREISSEQYRNEMFRRRNPKLYFKKRNRSKLRQNRRRIGL